MKKSLILVVLFLGVWGIAASVHATDCAEGHSIICKDKDYCFCR